MRHAVDGPVRVSVLVADGDGKTAVVGSQQVDHLVVVAARQRQHRSFARVRRPVFSLITYRNKNIKLKSIPDRMQLDLFPAKARCIINSWLTLHQQTTNNHLTRIWERRKTNPLCLTTTSYLILHRYIFRRYREKKIDKNGGGNNMKIWPDGGERNYDDTARVLFFSSVRRGRP